MRRVSPVCVCALTGACGLASQALAQQAQAAPTSAQRWETRFKVERFAPDGSLLSSNFASNSPHLNDPITYDTTMAVGRVDITYQGRVGILANTSGTDNLGISRLGGAGSATTGGRIFFVDALAQGAAQSQGTVALAEVPGTATGGVPNRGLFQPYRGALANWSPSANASNTDGNNGNVSNTATGSPVVFNFTGGRAVNFGDGPGGENYGGNDDGFVGTGPIVGAATIDGTTLAGSFADYYKVSYTPNTAASLVDARFISVQAQGQSGRYIYRYNGGGGASNGATANFANTIISFAVAGTIPSPGVMAVVVAGVFPLARRRRRA